MSESKGNDAVLLIHGTFSGDDADQGTRWWQRNSEAYRRLRETLPSSVSTADDWPIFHWGAGPNSERARSSAALRLLEQVERFEERGQPYHLIGHSHGGSVIWETLRRAVLLRENMRVDETRRARLRLPHLRSWTTIGTPFMQFEEAPIPFRDRIPGGNLSRRFEYWVATRATWLNPKWQAPLIVIVLTIVAFLLLLCPFVAIPILDNKFNLPEEVLGYLIIGAVFYEFFVLVGSVFLTALIAAGAERQQFLREKRAGRQAMVEFGPRWLGLYSTADEAINSLRATPTLALKVAHPLVLSERVFYSDQILGPARPLFWLHNLMFNWIFVPLTNRFISNQLSRFAQGNDRPGTIVGSVTTSPVADYAEIPPLPDELTRKLVAQADTAVEGQLPRVRVLLGQVAQIGLHNLTAEAAGALGDDGLVHCLYYRDDDILKLICHNICCASDPSIKWPEDGIGYGLINWRAESRAHVAKQIEQISLNAASN